MWQYMHGELMFAFYSNAGMLVNEWLECLLNELVSMAILCSRLVLKCRQCRHWTTIIIKDSNYKQPGDKESPLIFNRNWESYKWEVSFNQANMHWNKVRKQKKTRAVNQRAYTSWGLSISQALRHWPLEFLCRATRSRSICSRSAFQRRYSSCSSREVGMVRSAGVCGSGHSASWERGQNTHESWWAVISAYTQPDQRWQVSSISVRTIKTHTHTHSNIFGLVLLCSSNLEESDRERWAGTSNC